MRSAAQVLARRKAKPRVRRFFRHQAIFVRDPLAHSTPLDRNARAKVLHIAERLERRTKEKGRKNGALGEVGLQILRALIFRFAHHRTGLCFPSYLALQALTRRSRGAIAAALKRLERSGILRITRRLKRIAVERLSPITGRRDQVVITCQDSNLYAFAAPAGLVERLDALVETPSAPTGQLNLLARLAKRLEAESTTQGGEPSPMDNLWKIVSARRG